MKAPQIFQPEDFEGLRDWYKRELVDTNGEKIEIRLKSLASQIAQAIFEKWWVGERCKEKQLTPIDPVAMRQNLGRGKDEDDNIHSHYENGEDDCPLCCKDACLREQREDDDGN